MYGDIHGAPADTFRDDGTVEGSTRTSVGELPRSLHVRDRLLGIQPWSVRDMKQTLRRSTAPRRCPLPEGPYRRLLSASHLALSLAGFPVRRDDAPAVRPGRHRSGETPEKMQIWEPGSRPDGARCRFVLCP